MLASIIGLNNNPGNLFRCKTTGRFLPGHKPYNAGKKGIHCGGVATQFKKGNLPHNTKYDNCVSIRTNKRDNRSERYIRIAKAKWIPLKQFVWEQVNGPIPPKHIIAFIDGNTLNDSLENLMLISMKENLLRNQNREKASKSMRDAWRRAKIRKKFGLEPVNNLRVK